MNNCKFFKYETVGSIEHEICLYKELNKPNKNKNNESHCIGSRCGKYEEKDNKKTLIRE